MSLQRYIARRPHLRGVILCGGMPSDAQWEELERLGVPRRVLGDIIACPPTPARLAVAARHAGRMGLGAVAHRWLGADLRTIAVDTSVGRVQVTGTPDGRIVDSWPPGRLALSPGPS